MTNIFKENITSGDLNDLNEVQYRNQTYWRRLGGMDSQVGRYQ